MPPGRRCLTSSSESPSLTPRTLPARSSMRTILFPPESPLESPQASPTSEPAATASALIPATRGCPFLAARRIVSLNIVGSLASASAFCFRLEATAAFKQRSRVRTGTVHRDVVRSRAARTRCHRCARVRGAAPHIARRLRRVQRDARGVGVAGRPCAMAACARGNSRRRARPRVALAQWPQTGLTFPTGRDDACIRLVAVVALGVRTQGPQAVLQRSAGAR